MPPPTSLNRGGLCDPHPGDEGQARSLQETVLMIVPSSHRKEL